MSGGFIVAGRSNSIDGEYILAGYTGSDNGDWAGLRGRGIDYDSWIVKLNNTVYFPFCKNGIYLRGSP